MRKFFLPGIFFFILGVFFLKSFVKAETAPNLFFSEYIEGSSYNKALEIYNPTGSTIDLSGYKIEEYVNGNPGPPDHTINLSSFSLSTGNVYVVCHTSFVDPPRDTVCNLKTGSLDYNGNDAVVLKNRDTVIDVIGQLGVNPCGSGSCNGGWGTENTTTYNHTLVRKCGITQGDSNGNDIFDPSVEWDGYAIDTFSYLSSHTLCFPSPTLTPSPEPTPTPTPSSEPSPSSIPPSPSPTMTPTPTPTPNPTGSITVVKDTIPDYYQGFPFEILSPGRSVTFQLVDYPPLVYGGNIMTINGLDPGSYTIEENDPSSTGFILSAIDCQGNTNWSKDLLTRKVSLELTAGDNVTCKFTNTYVPTPSPTLEPTPTPVPTIEITPSPTLTSSPEPSPSPTPPPPSPTPTPSPEPTLTPTPTPEPTLTPTPTIETTPSPSLLPSPTSFPSPTPTPTPTPTPVHGNRPGDKLFSILILFLKDHLFKFFIFPKINSFHIGFNDLSKQRF